MFEKIGLPLGSGRMEIKGQKENRRNNFLVETIPPTNERVHISSFIHLSGRRVSGNVFSSKKRRRERPAITCQTYLVTFGGWIHTDRSHSLRSNDDVPRISDEIEHLST